MNELPENMICQCGQTNCTCRSPSGWSIERQVRLTSAVLILLGIALAYTVSANWIALSAFIALGMIFSAINNSCGLGLIISHMPWNSGRAKTSANK